MNLKMPVETSKEEQEAIPMILSFMPPPKQFLECFWTIDQYQDLNMSILQMCQGFNLKFTEKCIVKKSYDKFLTLFPELNKKNIDLAWDIFVIEVINIFAPEQLDILGVQISQKLENIEKLNEEQQVQKIKHSIALCINEATKNYELLTGKKKRSKKTRLICNLLISFPESLYLEINELLNISQQMSLLIKKSDEAPLKHDSSNLQKSNPTVWAALQFKKRYQNLLELKQQQ